ncbi:MAG TPA: hypothetical protein VFW33_04170 [Gemmataceae bacterium]|nr:hypothetical protein [Gemmataceae bacterium]
MFTFDYLLAAALLAAPADRDLALSPELFATVGPAAQQLALKWEILDPREVRYVLARPEDFAADLKLLQRRYHELANAPPVADCLRFPDRATVSDLLAFNRAYRQQMDARQAVELVHWWEYREAVQEADKLYQVWDNVRDARCDYYYVTVRRHALQKLREAIGPEAYYAGCLPPHVPVWRFQRID